MTAAAIVLPSRRAVAQSPRYASDPFTLGVASGYPTSSSIVLWTRLAPAPLTAGGGMQNLTVPVGWEIAADAGFTRVIASGSAEAAPALAHSVHVEVGGLSPGRRYWYRFTSGDAESPVGMTKTAPDPSARPRSVKFALASCQHYEANHYAAYRAIADDDFDLVVHVGDYIYENAGVSRVRSHSEPVATTLDDYRKRYALYKLDPSLQSAHAAAPWAATWDDHEVVDDYAGTFGRGDVSPDDFLRRRSAAYQAYFEHLPLPPRMRPEGATMPIYTHFPYSGLAEIYLLDGRQYRSPHACGLRLVEPCREMGAPDRTMLGAEQERWLNDSLAASDARWNVLAQQTVFAAMDQQPGPGVGYWSDGWSGYPSARRRLVDSLRETGVDNPVILSGDLHAWLVNDIHRDPGSNDSEVIATEVVTTSISSRGPAQQSLDNWQSENSNIRFAHSEHRGFTRLTLTEEHLDIDLMAVDDASRADSETHALGSWRVLDGRPGVIR